jgi:hypothetical protein
LCNSGAVISWNSGAQGWSYFLQSQARYADPAAGELVQSFACVEIGMGINDLAQHPDSDVGHAPILEAFRRVIVRARSAAVIEDNDSSASYTGSWSALASTDKNSGAGWRQSRQSRRDGRGRRAVDDGGRRHYSRGIPQC